MVVRAAITAFIITDEVRIPPGFQKTVSSIRNYRGYTRETEFS